MMKKRILGTVIVGVSMMMLSGCNSDNPETIVENYIKAWNSASLEEIEQYVDAKTKEQIEDRLDRCISNSSSSIVYDALKKYKAEVKKTWQSHNPFYAFKSISKVTKKQEAEIKKIVNDTSLEYNDKTLQLGLLLLSQAEVYKKVKSTMSPVAYKMFAFTFINKVRAQSGDIMGTVDRYEQSDYFKSLILKEMKSKGSEAIEEVEKKCYVYVFKPESIKKINIIETKVLSADRKDVKVELLYNDSRSQKKHIDVEKIADQWCVTTLL